MSEHAFVVTIRFDSDWSIGSGDGIPGHIDAQVRRDPSDGLPFVPAKTVRGIWRDMCEQVARGLDGASEGAWAALVDALFGRQSKPSSRLRGYVTSSEGRLRLAPARLRERVRQRIAASRPLADALFLLKPGVTIDRRTGSALSRHFRIVERVVAGCELVAEGTVDLACCTDVDGAKRFLERTAARIERIGGQRRRGAGRCAVELKFNEETAVGAIPQVTPAFVAALSTPVAVEAPTGGDTWLALRLDLDLVTPVAVPDATLGNVVTSRDCITGSHLLPALHTSLAEALGAARAGAGIVAGDIQCGYALPLIGGVRALPIAACLRQDKGLPEAAWGDALAGLPDDASTSWKPLRGGYGVAREPFEWTTVKIQKWTHNTVNDDLQRPDETVGGVYTFEAIPAGLRYASVLRVRCDAAERDALEASLVRVLTGRALRLGAARNSDYGLVRIAAVKREAIALQAGGGLSLVLLAVSDLVVRDVRDVPRADAATWLAALRRAAFESGVDWGASVGNVDLAAAGRFIVPRRIDGWNTRHRARRSTLVAIGAGSVLHIALRQPLPQAFRERLAQGGLGERRGEGFGEIAVDPPWLVASGAGAVLAHRPSGVDVAPTVAGEGGVDDTLLDRLAERAWRHWIAERAESRAFADPAFVHAQLGLEPDRPGNAQLGNLLDHIRRIRAPDDCERLGAWLGKLGRTPKRSGGWPERTCDIVRTLSAGGAAAVDLVWSWLDADGDDSGRLARSTGTVAAAMRDKHFAFALNSVLFAAAHRLRRSREVPVDEQEAG